MTSDNDGRQEIPGMNLDNKYSDKKPIVPEEKEIEQNPRSRSAKLRAIEKK